MGSVILKKVGYLSLVVLLFGCSLNNNDYSPVIKNNIIVLVDPSVRLLDDEQVEKEKEAILYLLKLSIERTKKIIIDNGKDFNIANDEIRIKIAPTSLGSEVDAKNPEIHLNFDKNNLDWEYVLSDAYLQDCEKELDQLYKTIVYNKSSNELRSVDLWQYFDNVLPNDIFQTTLANNYLFVFSDGYFNQNASDSPTTGNRYKSMSFLKNIRNTQNIDSLLDYEDYGLVKIQNNAFSDLKVMLVGLSPNNDLPEEKNLITGIWSKWLSEMGLKKQGYSFVENENFKDFQSDFVAFMDSEVVPVLLANKDKKAADKEASADAKPDEVAKPKEVETTTGTYIASLSNDKKKEIENVLNGLSKDYSAKKIKEAEDGIADLFTSKEAEIIKLGNNSNKVLSKRKFESYIREIHLSDIYIDSVVLSFNNKIEKLIIKESN